MWCVFVCGLETSRMRSPWLALGRSAIAKGKKKVFHVNFPTLKGYSNDIDIFWKCIFFIYFAKLIGLDILSPRTTFQYDQPRGQGL